MMIRNQRERVLAILLATSLVLGVGSHLVDSLVLQPLDQKHRRLSALRFTVADRKDDLLEVIRVSRELDEISTTSLPEDPALSATLYQQWLIETANELGITAAQITPGRAVEEADLGHRIPFSFRAEVSESQLGRFLDRITSLPVLHAVSSFSIVAEKPGAKQLQLNLSCEAVALSGTRQDVDVSLAELADRSTASDDGRDSESPDEAVQIFARKLFVAGYRPPRPPAPPTQPRPEPAKPDERLDVYLVGAVVQGSRREAWFLDRSSQRETIAQVGETVTLAGIRMQVQHVEERHVKLINDGQEFLLELGQHLGEMTTWTTTQASDRSQGSSASSVASFGLDP